MKSILVIIGFVFAFLVVYLGYRMDKREEMHLRKIHMAKEKKYKSNKKQIESMISKFTNVINAKTKNIENSDVLISEDEEIDDSSILNEQEEEAIQDNTDVKDINVEDTEDISINDIDINDIDIDDMILDEESVEPEEEPIVEETVRTYTESEDDELEDFIKTIHIEESEREELKTSSKDIVAGLVKEYDNDVEENLDDSTNIANDGIVDLDENSEVETFMDIINPRRYTRKKKKKEIKKNIKRYTRKKSGRKSKKKAGRRYYSTGVVLSKKPRIKKEPITEKIQIEDPNDTSEYVDYKEILSIIEPVGIKDEKNVEVVTVDISDIEPFMPKRDVVQKRGRGRPRKEVTEVKPKRGRGRPRKEVTEVKPKRKRGRPRKNEAVEQEQ